MRKLITILCLIVAAQTSAQVKTFSLIPSCPQVRSTADSVNILTQLQASDGVRSITWSQVSGPSVKIPIPIIASDGKTLTSGFTLKGLTPGIYVFQALGASLTGVTGYTNDSVQVIQAPRRIAYTMTVYSDSTRIINQ